MIIVIFVSWDSDFDILRVQQWEDNNG